MKNHALRNDLPNIVLESKNITIGTNELRTPSIDVCNTKMDHCSVNYTYKNIIDRDFDLKLLNDAIKTN